MQSYRTQRRTLEERQGLIQAHMSRLSVQQRNLLDTLRDIDEQLTQIDLMIDRLYEQRAGLQTHVQQTRTGLKAKQRIDKRPKSPSRRKQYAAMRQATHASDHHIVSTTYQRHIVTKRKNALLDTLDRLSVYINSAKESLERITQQTALIDQQQQREDYKLFRQLAIPDKYFVAGDYTIQHEEEAKRRLIHVYLKAPGDSAMFGEHGKNHGHVVGLVDSNGRITRASRRWPGEPHPSARK